MIVITEAENSIVVHQKDEISQVAINNYLQAIQSCGASDLVIDN